MMDTNGLGERDMKKGLYILIPLLLFFSTMGTVQGQETRSSQDETIYYITVDRFNNSDFSIDFEVDANDPLKYNGGDFQGIIDRLDYIKDMGFTTIALSPIFDNETNGFHGYWVKDYFNTEEHFGSIETFKELVKKAHDRDMSVVINFFITAGAEPATLIEAGKWWIEQTDVDGYWLDSEEELSLEFVENFSKEIKPLKEDFLLLADVPSEKVDYIQYKEAGVDALLDYVNNDNLREVFSEPNKSFETIVTEQEMQLATFMDNHHTYRFTRDMVTKNQHPGPRWKLALTYLYTTPGIPIVYYGSEIALDGGEEPDNMRLMDFRTDPELVDYMTSIGKLRNQFPSLTRGTFEVLHEEDGVVVYKREYEGETTVVAINNTSKTQSAHISAKLADDMELRGLLNGDKVQSKDGGYNIIIDRDEAEIYLLAEKTGANIPFVIATLAVVFSVILFIIMLKRRARTT